MRRAIISAVLATGLLLSGATAPAVADTVDCDWQVTGRLVDAYSASPLGGWRIVDTSGVGALSAQTDQQGRFSLRTCSLAPEERRSLLVRMLTPAIRDLHVASFTFPKNGHVVALGDVKVKRPTTVTGRLLTASGKPIAHARITAFDAQGRAVAFPKAPADGTETDPQGFFDLEGARSGTYRLGVTLNFTPTYGTRANTGSASFFWSSKGPTSSFAAASPIVLRSSSASGALRRFSHVMHAPGGARATGTIRGTWEDSVVMTFQRVGNPRDSAHVAQAEWAGLKVVKRTDMWTTYRYRSTPLLPGTYRLVSWSHTFDKAGHVIGSATFYWTGAGKRPSTKASDAKTIVVESGTATLDLGAFDMIRR